jgi:hypothetical protein
MVKDDPSRYKPRFRRLYGYSFDPSLSTKMDTAMVNKTVFNIDWEKLKPGPVGKYLEIIDFDPASKCFYKPVDLNDRFILAQDGLLPSESNPQFHQQMVYAVAMTTIQNFEKALGRKALWSSYRKQEDGKMREDKFLPRLRIYPHALRQANAYYSPTKKALLFGYFPASDNAPGEQFPGGIVFTCLSHDIVAHETTHALLDGMHQRFIEPSHPDALAFHEAFADVVALFQHFTFPDVLRHQIAKTRGDLSAQNMLGELAQQFGRAIGRYGALREYIVAKADPAKYQTIFEPHERGAILVAAIFGAFTEIYKTRVADLYRVASSGTGVLPEGDLHPDLVNRLANEASKVAQHVLNMCIRALDYCPPVDINFGDYLRAIITADTDLVPDDDLGYRIAFIESFRKGGIYPRDIRTLSEDSLCWNVPRKNNPLFESISKFLLEFVSTLEHVNNRETIFEETRNFRGRLHTIITDCIKDKIENNRYEDVKEFEKMIGLYLSVDPAHVDAPAEDAGKPGKTDGLRWKDGKPKFEIHSLRGARRIGPDGDDANQVMVSLIQTRDVAYDENISMDKLPDDERENVPAFKFRGGCNLIFDLNKIMNGQHGNSLRYVVRKVIDDEARLKRHRDYRTGENGMSLHMTYSGRPDQSGNDEPFAFLHNKF